MKKHNNEKYIEEHLTSAFEEMTPDLFDSIKNRIKEEETNKPEISKSISDSKKRFKSRRFFGLSAAIAAILCICILPFYFTRSVDGTIYIDVNPSVSITYNNKGNVVSIQAENDDGQNLLQSLDFEQSSSSVSATIGQIFDQLDENGYFNDQGVNMIVTNCGNKTGKTAITEDDIDAAVDSYLESQDLDATWVYQSFIADKKLSQSADEKHLSVGKLYFLTHAAENNDIDNETLEHESVTHIFQKLKEEHISLDSDQYCKVRTRKKQHNQTVQQNSDSDTESESLDSANNTETNDSSDISAKDSVQVKQKTMSDNTIANNIGSDSLKTYTESILANVFKNIHSASNKQISSDGTTESATESTTETTSEKVSTTENVSESATSSEKASTRIKKSSQTTRSSKLSTGKSSSKKKILSGTSNTKKNTVSNKSLTKKISAGTSSSNNKSASSKSSSKKKTISGKSSSKKKSVLSKSSSKKKSALSKSSSKKKSASSNSSSKDTTLVKTETQEATSENDASDSNNSNASANVSNSDDSDNTCDSSGSCDTSNSDDSTNSSESGDS